LTACPNQCGRTFLPDRVALHLKGCLAARGDHLGHDPAVRKRYNLPPKKAKGKFGTTRVAGNKTTSSNSNDSTNVVENELDRSLLDLLEAWGAVDAVTLAALRALKVTNIEDLAACLQEGKTSEADFKRVGLNDFRRRKLASALRSPSPGPRGRSPRSSQSDFDTRGVRDRTYVLLFLTFSLDLALFRGFLPSNLPSTPTLRTRKYYNSFLCTDPDVSNRLCIPQSACRQASLDRANISSSPRPTPPRPAASVRKSATNNTSNSNGNSSNSSSRAPSRSRSSNRSSAQARSASEGRPPQQRWQKKKSLQRN